MGGNVKQKLWEVLENLDKYQFKKFKSCLENNNYDGRGTIPRSKLEEVDPVELRDLMCKFFTEDHVIKMCISVLEDINERQLAANLKGQRDKDSCSTEIPGTSAREFRAAYRDYIFKNFRIMNDSNSRLGEYVLLNQRYSELIILKHHRSEEEREHEIMSLGRKHVEIWQERTRSSITIESLFRPDENGLIPDVVVLQGAAGIGKTMTAKKITLDCACGELYQGMFDYTFYINCREMNLHTEESSIAEMILKSWADNNWSREILKNPERLLFIIDGFDELRYSLDLPEDDLCTDPWKKQPVRILLNSLFRRKLLPKSNLIITTRPTAQDQLRKCLKFSRYAEILGFSEKEREEYFYKFFQDHELAAQAFVHVKQNETLFTMCFVPIVCWIVCTVIKQQMKKSKDVTRSSKTLTSIYVLYLYMLKSQHNPSEQFMKSNLKGLCSLALDGIWKREILFGENEIRKRGLGQEDSLPLFLSESIFQRDIDCECAYSFIHLSFQEFFAALSYILDEENALNSEKPDPDLKTLLKLVMTSRPDFELTVRFLFGLLNQETMKDLGGKCGWKISPKIKPFLLEWMKENKKLDRDVWDHKLLFYCLYEMQDEEFAKCAQHPVTKISLSLDTNMEEVALTYCLEYCCRLKDLHLVATSAESVEDGKDMTVGKDVPTNLPLRQQYSHGRCGDLLFKCLTSLNCNLSSLWLNGFSLTEVHCKDLAQFLSKTPTLKELDLSVIVIEEVGMKLLCEGLRYCKLEKLRLTHCRLTEACCQDLAQVLQKSQTLTELRLSGIPLKDTAMNKLCEGLQHPECKLQSLWLGQKQLCAGLQHTECKLHSLGFEYCGFSETFCQDLAQVLRKSQRLTELHLFSIPLRDTGMKQLCEGLQHPGCKLQSLWMENCKTRETCFQDLAQVLRKSRRLTSLHLSRFPLRDTGIKQLCEGLQHPECKLQSLSLRNCGLTSAVLEDFSIAIMKNQSLTDLAISGVRLRNSYTKKLHEALELSRSRRTSQSSNAVLKREDGSMDAKFCSMI